MIVDIVEEYEPAIIESETPPLLVDAAPGNDGILFNDKFSADRRLRQAVYDRIKKAAAHLPENLTFMIYEAYRPRARQIALWNEIMEKVKQSYPQADDGELALRCNTFIANPYKVGSGHQFGCAVDITLFDTKTGREADMGCGVQEFCGRCKTDTPLITPDQRANRDLLRGALHREGLVNYPPEWWHFSYGDRQWAIQLNRAETLYGVLPF